MSEPISGINDANKKEIEKADELHRAASSGKISARQGPSKPSFNEGSDQGRFNPLNMSKMFKTIRERVGHLKAQMQEVAREAIKETETTSVDFLAKIAKEYQKKNPELTQKGLLNLKQAVKQGDLPKDIIAKALKFYPDQFLSDEALSYLLETSDEESDLHKALLSAKKQFGGKYEREITSGKNINTEAREFSRQGLGTPEGLRNLYRDITGNPRDANTMFDELSQTFTFDKLKTALGFLLHSLGSDLKAKGSSIEKPELMRLITETKFFKLFSASIASFQIE